MYYTEVGLPQLLGTTETYPRILVFPNQRTNWATIMPRPPTPHACCELCRRKRCRGRKMPGWTTD